MNVRKMVKDRVKDTEKCIGKCVEHNTFSCLNCAVFLGRSTDYGHREPIPATTSGWQEKEIQGRIADREYTPTGLEIFADAIEKGNNSAEVVK